MPIPSDWSWQFAHSLDEMKRNSGAEEYLADNPFPRFVLTEQAASWNEFLGWVNELKGSWCFRGQRDSEWLLYTSLDRAVRRKESASTGGFEFRREYSLNRETEQRELLFRFQQQAHLYIRNPPSSGDLASWFALMQHHGAPTRFLDWTKSPFVAAYFAFEQAHDKEKRPAVWAIDLDWLDSRGLELLQSKGTAPVSDDPKQRARWLNGLLSQIEEPVVIRVDPRRGNERMAAQLGVFLCKLLHEASFSQTLMRMMLQQAPDQPVVRKLEVQANCRTEFLTNLRAMNIHRASLFPGLDGFGQFLRIDLEIKDAGE